MDRVGTQKVFENDRVIVWNIELEPGEQGERHTHELDYFVRVFSGSTVEVCGADGKPLYTVEREAGAAVSFRIDGDQLVPDQPGASPIPATHSARNVGKSTFGEILVEFKN